MASGLTNRGFNLILEMAFRNTIGGGAIDAQPFFVALVTDAVTPVETINTFGELTEIAAGNGYTSGGYAVNRNSTDWDTLSEEDASHYAAILLKDIAWSAVGGSIPSAGDGARFAVILTDEAVVADRQVIGWVDLTTARSVGVGAQLTLQDIELRLRQP